MKHFLIFVVISLALLYQVYGAPDHLLVETEDGNEEPRMGDYLGKDKDFQGSSKYC